MQSESALQFRLFFWIAVLNAVANCEQEGGVDTGDGGFGEVVGAGLGLGLVVWPESGGFGDGETAGDVVGAGGDGDVVGADGDAGVARSALLG